MGVREPSYSASCDSNPVRLRAADGVRLGVWVNRRQLAAIAYLREENCVLREQLGTKRPKLSPSVEGWPQLLSHQGARRRRLVDRAQRDDRLGLLKARASPARRA